MSGSVGGSQSYVRVSGRPIKLCARVSGRPIESYVIVIGRPIETPRVMCGDVWNAHSQSCVSVARRVIEWGCEGGPQSSCESLQIYLIVPLTLIKLPNFQTWNDMEVCGW